MTRGIVGFGLILGLAAYGAGVLAQSTPAPPATAYAWADSCKTCHEPVYLAWAKTKHASALNRLSAAEQEKECVGCHLTGPKTKVIDANKVLNQGVQCESCHGAAAAHVKDPAVRAGLTKVPPASRCEECHSDKSPHFKGFFYSAMAGLSHKVP